MERLKENHGRLRSAIYMVLGKLDNWWYIYIYIYIYIYNLWFNLVCINKMLMVGKRISWLYALNLNFIMYIY
jgi:hypothetical protein